MLCVNTHSKLETLPLTDLVIETLFLLVVHFFSTIVQDSREFLHKTTALYLLCLSIVCGGQLATGWGSSGMREDKKVLKKTQTVHMMDTL